MVSTERYDAMSLLAALAIFARYGNGVISAGSNWIGWGSDGLHALVDFQTSDQTVLGAMGWKFTQQGGHGGWWKLILQ